MCICNTHFEIVLWNLHIYCSCCSKHHTPLISALNPVDLNLHRIANTVQISSVPFSTAVPFQAEATQTALQFDLLYLGICYLYSLLEHKIHRAAIYILIPKVCFGKHNTRHAIAIWGVNSTSRMNLRCTAKRTESIQKRQQQHMHPLQREGFCTAKEGKHEAVISETQGRTPRLKRWTHLQFAFGLRKVWISPLVPGYKKLRWFL